MQFIDLKSQYQGIKEVIDKRIQAVLEHGQYINGPEVSELENDLAKYTGAKHAIACANGTDALSIALMALGIGPGDEVISTPFTFFATGETVALAGAKLVFADIDPDTFNIDANKIEAVITDKTKAIIPVSLYGQCPDLNQIMEIAKKHNLKVIEDAAQSFGAEVNGKKSCSIADISTTSFFPAKPLGCYGDGGALFTNDDDLATAIKEIRNHGQSKRYTHTRIGVNSRLDTLQAGILIEKLKIFPKEVEDRQRIAKRYDVFLREYAKVTKVREGHTSVYAQYTLEVDHREKFLEKMKERNIPIAVHYPIQIHEQPVFKDLGYSGDYEFAKHAAARVISIPMHPYMDEKTQDHIIKNIIEVIKELK